MLSPVVYAFKIHTEIVWNYLHNIETINNPPIITVWFGGSTDFSKMDTQLVELKGAQFKSLKPKNIPKKYLRLNNANNEKVIFDLCS